MKANVACLWTLVFGTLLSMKFIKSHWILFCVWILFEFDFFFLVKFEFLGFVFNDLGYANLEFNFLLYWWIKNLDWWKMKLGLRFDFFFLIIFKFLYTVVFLWVRSIDLIHLTIYYVTRHLILYFLWLEPRPLIMISKEASINKVVHEIAKILKKKKCSAFAWLILMQSQGHVCCVQGRVNV